MQDIPKAPSPVIPKVPSPVIQPQQLLDRKIPIERDITQEYIPPPNVIVNNIPTRRKSVSPVHQAQQPKVHPRSHSTDRLTNEPVRPRPISVVPPPEVVNPPPKMKGLDPSDPKSPKTKGKAIVLVRPTLTLLTVGKLTTIYTTQYHWKRRFK